MSKKIEIVILLTFAFVFMLGSCDNMTPQEKAIRRYLQLTLNDPKSYEPVGFTTLTLDDINLLDLEIGSFVSNVKQYQTVIFNMPKVMTESKFDTVNQMVKRISLDIADIFIKTNEGIDHNNFPDYKELVFNHIDKVDDLIEYYVDNPEVYRWGRVYTKSFFDAYFAIREDVTDAATECEHRLSNLNIPYSSIDDYFNSGNVILHEYRAKNSFGALILIQSIFFIDPVHGKVISDIKL